MKNLQSKYSSKGLTVLAVNVDENAQDTKRFSNTYTKNKNFKVPLDNQGKKLSHILHPHTGWPVTGSPSAVTVKANTCIEAGFLSTMAMLQGAQAESFLNHQQVAFEIEW